MKSKQEIDTRDAATERDSGEPLEDLPGRDPVEESSRESFPASDVPSWTPVLGPMPPPIPR